MGFSCTNYLKIQGKNKKVHRKKNMPSGYVLNPLITDYYVGMLTLMIRKSAYDSLEVGFNSSYHILGDMDLVIRISENWEMAYLKEILGYYRIHSENESLLKKDLLLREYIIWSQNISVIIPNLSKIAKSAINNQICYISGSNAVDNMDLTSATRQLFELRIIKLQLKLLVKIFILFFQIIKNKVSTSVFSRN